MNIREYIKEEGRQDREKEVILNMLKEKFDISAISKAIGLPEAEIVKFKNGEFKSAPPASDQSQAKASDQNGRAE